jgi:filamentous hemagglutinin family protein
MMIKNLASLINISLFFWFFPHQSVAQIIPDGSLGNENSLVIREQLIKNLPSDLIEGGTTRGNNLFHSFTEFNINQGRGAYFTNPTGIKNILTRVTGNNISQIFGTLGVLGNANLFFLNPHGIIFGPQAALDLNGSFLATTAESILFDNYQFSASNPQAPPLLTINIPLGLRFRNNPGDINITNTSSLNLAPRQTLTFVGGNVSIALSLIDSPGTQIELGSLAAAGVVTLNEDLSLSFPENVVRGDITLENGTLVNVQGADGGSITIDAGNVAILSESTLLAGIKQASGTSESQAGDIIINSTGKVTVDDLSLIANSVGEPTVILLLDDFSDFLNQTKGNGGKIEIDSQSLSLSNNSIISTVTLGEGNAGEIKITTDSLSVHDSIIAAQTFGNGNTNNINVNNANTIILDGFFSSGNISIGAGLFNNVNGGGVGKGGDIKLANIGSLWLNNSAAINTTTLGIGDAGAVIIEAQTVSLNLSSDIFTTVAETGVGNSGGIVIDTTSLSLTNGAVINANTFGQGNAGQIRITASEGLTVDGEDSQGFFSGVFSRVENTGLGNSGGIVIDTTSLALTNGAAISASTFGQGNAGQIRITASEGLTVDGEDSQGGSSGLFSAVADTAAGNSGGILINTNSLALTNGAVINVNTFGQGNAGQIRLQASDSLTIDGEDSQGFSSGVFSIVADTGVGNSEGIEIDTTSLTLTHGAEINATTFGQGNAGQIRIAASDGITLDESNVFSRVENTGLGNSEGILIETTSLILSNGAVVSASTFGQGNAGQIRINASDGLSLDESNVVSQVADTGVGNSEGIEIDTTSLTLTNGAEINATTLGQGNAGQIRITASDGIILDGENSQGFSSGVFSTVADTGAGNSEGIVIDTASLSLSRGAVIDANTFGQGNAGQIRITASDGLSLDESNVVSQVADTGVGNSEGIEIDTTSLTLTNGAEINATTLGQGNAGQIRITASDGIILDGENSQGFSSGVFSTVADTGAGNSEGIVIDTASLSLTRGAEIDATTSGQGNAGQINITASDGIILDGEDSQGFSSGVLSAVADTGAGNSEGIVIDTASLSLTRGAVIDTTTFGQGNAGQINITASEGITLDGQSSQGVGSGVLSAVADTGAGSAGDIKITTNSLSLTEEAFISAETTGAGIAGNITIQANTLEANTGQISATTSSDFPAGDITLNIADNLILNGADAGLFAQTTGAGKAGDIIINTLQLTITEGATISAFTEAVGDGGNIIINAPVSLTLGANGNLTVETSAAGQAGNITITSDTVTIGQDAQISATATATATSTNQQGGGSIAINASNLNITGQLGIFAETAGAAPAGSLQLQPNSNNPNLNIRFTGDGLISALTTASGDGGSISLSAPGQIDIQGQGSITVETQGSGKAGDINLSASSLNLREGVTISASTTGAGSAGNINLNLTNHLNLDKSSIIASTGPESTGEGGNVNLSAREIHLNNSADMAVDSQGEGNGGSIFLRAENLGLQHNSTISAATASGEGGNIALHIAHSIFLTNQSPLTATAGGTGNGGNIDIDTKFLIAADGSNITANAFEGRGGNINLTALGIFLRDSEITASSELGIDGIVETNTPEVDPSRGIVELPKQVVDPSELIAQNACERGKESEFFITGKGGLPASPNQLLEVDVTEVELVEPAWEETTPSESDQETRQPSANQQSIIPARGWIRNEKGQVVLVGYNPRQAAPGRSNAQIRCQPR